MLTPTAQPAGEEALTDVSPDALRDDYDALDRRHGRRTDHSTTSLRRTIEAQAAGKGPRIEALEQQHQQRHRRAAHRHPRDRSGYAKARHPEPER